jgi:hypothetical protein
MSAAGGSFVDFPPPGSLLLSTVRLTSKLRWMDAPKLCPSLARSSSSLMQVGVICMIDGEKLKAL